MIARLASPLVFAAFLALAGTSAFAERGPNPPSVTPAPAPAPAAPEASVDPATGALVETTPAAKTKDGKSEHLVTEDSQVKIEETRVRGVTTKIVVHSKITGGSYELKPEDLTKPLDPRTGKPLDPAAGQRTFNWTF